jgi:hypothetical protein
MLTIKPTDAALHTYNSMRTAEQFHWIGLAIVDESRIDVIYTDRKTENSNFRDAWYRLLDWLENEMAAKPCYIVVNVNKIENGKNSNSIRLITWIPKNVKLRLICYIVHLKNLSGLSFRDFRQGLSTPTICWI